MPYEWGWGYYPGTVAFWLIASHYLSMATNTLYLHRYLAHGSFAMHWLLREFCKLEVWLKSGMNPWYWAAVHRKHHIFTDDQGDPHSPLIFGNWRVLFGQAFYYRQAIRDDPKIMKYVPEMESRLTFVDRYFYCSRFGNPMGPVIFLVVSCFLFRLPAAADNFFYLLWSFWPGVLMWLLLMADVPLAGGVINGIGHWSGKIRNIVKKDFYTLGEMLHGNHHKYPWSAYLAHVKGEIDPGKWLLKLLGKLGLAKNAKYPGLHGEHLIDPLV